MSSFEYATESLKGNTVDLWGASEAEEGGTRQVKNKMLYDDLGRLFRIVSERDAAPKSLSGQNLHFVVKFQRGQSDPFAQLEFLEAQPITLYTTTRKVSVAMVVCVDEVHLSQTGRTAYIRAWIVLEGNKMKQLRTMSDAVNSSTASAMNVAGLLAPNTGQTLQQNETSSINKVDPSLLHQITSLQQENQELLATRNTLEKEVREIKDAMKTIQDNHEKEREQFIETQKSEMEKKWNAFMKGWVDSMQKENPEVISKVQSGIEQLIKQGKSKDHVWELLCCASQAHTQNVNTIEELTKTNEMLSQKNRELQDTVRSDQGFANEDARFAKRPRDMSIPTEAGSGSTPAYCAIPNTGMPLNEPPNTSDVWGQFESLMRSTNNRGTY